MPDSKFLEEYPLYRKFPIIINKHLQEISKVNINMYCKECDSNQTFNMINQYHDGLKKNYDPYITDYDSSGQVVRIKYVCAHCEKFSRYFILKINENLDYIMKVGQFPSWNISISKNMKEILGDFTDYFEKGKILESQAYGIGAYAYYRRIVEETIDELLDLISDLISDEEREKYEEALAETKKTKVTREKIELVKDLLPPILKPKQFNPLKTLHEVLSEGLHGRSDEECLEDASIIRNVLIFLVNSILKRKKDQDEFTKGMKKILEKRKERNK